jgi:hypothetical protein
LVVEELRKLQRERGVASPDRRDAIDAEIAKKNKEIEDLDGVILNYLLLHNHLCRVLKWIFVTDQSIVRVLSVNGVHREVKATNSRDTVWMIFLYLAASVVWLPPMFFPHNPKVGGSNPPPQPNLLIRNGLLIPTQRVIFAFGKDSGKKSIFLSLSRAIRCQIAHQFSRQPHAYLA